MTGGANRECVMDKRCICLDWYAFRAISQSRSHVPLSEARKTCGRISRWTSTVVDCLRGCTQIPPPVQISTLEGACPRVESSHQDKHTVYVEIVPHERRPGVSRESQGRRIPAARRDNTRPGKRNQVGRGVWVRAPHPGRVRSSATRPAFRSGLERCNALALRTLPRFEARHRGAPGTVDFRPPQDDNTEHGSEAIPR